jgi:vacuolar-type H+-ATPase subunit F/Vma7
VTRIGMRVVAVGGRAFVSAMKLAGAGAILAETAEEALRAVNSLIGRTDVGLVLVSLSTPTQQATIRSPSFWR